MQLQQYTWFDGKFVKSEDAKVPILTHSLQYGSGIFEGIRAYKTDKGPAIFRLKDHVKRFINTAKIYSMKLGYSSEELQDAIVETVRKNKLSSAYIRPFAFYNDTHIGLDVIGKKVGVTVTAIDFGNYFSDKDKGIKCKFSTWHRINSLVLPPQAKASGHYINSIIASTEAKNNGAQEAILTSTQGYIAEGPGENFFLVKDGEIVTPSKEADILLGITRDSIIKIAENIGMVVEERNVHKEEAYTCDEAFFAGTAAELTPIIEIDSRKIGSGKLGPLTKILEEKYYDIVTGKNPEFKDWLTMV